MPAMFAANQRMVPTYPRPAWVGDVRVRRARRRDLDTWRMWQALGRRT